MATTSERRPRAGRPSPPPGSFADRRPPIAIRKDSTLFEAAEARAFSGPDEADRQDAVASLPRAPPRPAASRVRRPECGAHGAFHAAGPNGGRAVSLHWGTGAPRRVILAPPEPNAEPPRDEQIRGDEPVSTATPDGIRNAHQEQRSRGGDQHVSGRLDGSDLAEAIRLLIEKERGFVPYSRTCGRDTGDSWC